MSVVMNRKCDVVVTFTGMRSSGSSVVVLGLLLKRLLVGFAVVVASSYCLCSCLSILNSLFCDLEYPYLKECRKALDDSNHGPKV